MRCRHHVVLGYTPYLFVVLVATYCQDSATVPSTVPSTLSSAITTPEIVPESPKNLTSTTLNSSAIELRWDPVSEADEYIIKWQAQNDETDARNATANENVTVFTIGGLKPWTDYNFTVIASRNKSKSGPIITTNKTHPDAPCQPENMRINQTNPFNVRPTLRIEWSKPNCTNGPLNGYEVIWKIESDQNRTRIDTNTTFTEVDNLKPWTDYQFFLFAYNNAENGSRLRSKELSGRKKTDQSKPCRPGNITISQTNPYHNQPVLAVQWMEPNCNNGPLDGYIYWMKQGSDQRINKTVTTNTSITVRDLEPWTDYVFFVLAFNDAPDKRLTSKERSSTIKTNPSDPESPTDLTLTCNETTLHAEWSPPNITNGDINGYIISWNEGQCNLDKSDKWMTTNETKYFVEDLEPATDYSFSIFAFIEFQGVVLNGTKDCKQCRTADDYPLRPSNVSCEVVNSSTISISWQEPALKRGKILNYTVSYSKSNSLNQHSTPFTYLVINELEAYTEYKISVSAWTLKGQGNWTTPVTCKTLSAVPNVPSEVSATTIDSKSIYVEWSASIPYPGNITYRVITEKLYCGTKDKIFISNNTNGGHTKTEITDLDPYTEYIISVSAATDAGSSNLTSTNPVWTFPTVPGKVSELKLDCSIKSNIISLSWQSPDKPNGVITSYLIKYTGVKDGKETHIDEKKKPTNGDPCKPEKLSISFDNLKPEYKYSFSVSAKVADVESYGPPLTKECTLSAGIPPLPEKNISVLESLKEEIVFELHNDTFSDRNGDIVEYAIIVAEAGNIEPPKAKERNSEKLPTWSEFQKNGSVRQYQATPEGWNPFNDSGKKDTLECRFKEMENVGVCTLGCQVKCNAIYCNGPLTPGMHYGFKLRGYTRNGFSETWPVETSTKSEPKSSIGNIITAVAVAISVFLLIIAGGFLFHRYGTVRAHQLILRLSPRRFLKSTVMPRAQAPPSDIFSFTPSVTHTRPVKLSDFSNHVSCMMADSALKFSQEFDELKSVSPSHPCSAAMLPDNRPKNRWINILPFDHSRVKLLPVDDEPASDYINGSYIPGFTCHREYIATQGPLPGTVDDMWRMIWEQGVNMIVMLTQCVERGKTKCEQYWPAEAQNATYGDLKVQTMSESVLSDYTIRTFDLSLGSRHRVITHLHFTKWPDFGCPENTELLINFVRAVRDHISEGDPSPLLVHCSAGVGRTGTFIAVDRLMQHIVLHDYADIFQNVLDMREHRTNMVQTEDQYIYIHECVRDLVQEKLARNRDSFKNDNFYENIHSHITTNM